MRNPTNVTKDSISAESGSSRKARSSDRSPAAIQLRVRLDDRAPVAREVRDEPRVGRDGGQGRRADPTAETKDLPSRVPSSALTAKPARGMTRDQPERAHRARVTTSGG